MSFKKILCSGPSSIPRTAENTVRTSRSPSSLHGIGSTLSGLLVLSHKSPPTTGESPAASLSPRHSLAELMQQERPTAHTASFLNEPSTCAGLIEMLSEPTALTASFLNDSLPPRPPSGGPNITRHELSNPARTTRGVLSKPSNTRKASESSPSASPNDAAHASRNQFLESALDGCGRALQRSNPKYKNWNEVQVVNSRFSKQAHQKLSNTSRLASEIMAVGAGREAYNLSVFEATKPMTINNIRYETANLNHQTRPAVSKPVESSGRWWQHFAKKV
ncbi:MAG: hypothetical protein JF606_18390 [Burkholderiales bacterium]|nr:hypothetical protein [Burkholderiales bacterium]